MKKMKLATIVSSVGLAASLFASSAGAAPMPVKTGVMNLNVNVLLNGRIMSFPDAQPFQDDQGSVMVPIRFISETLGAKVSLNFVGKSKTVTVADDKHKMSMTVGQTAAVVNGTKKDYGTKVMIKQDRTFVPLRLFSEGLGQTVEWDKVGRWVWIGSKEVPTLSEAGLKPVSLDPYRKWFKNAQDLLKSPREDITYTKALIFKITDLPSAFVRDIYSIEPYTDPKTTNVFLKVRAKTTSTSGNLFYLTDKTDIRFRNPIDSMTINNGDGTKFCFYKIWSSADKTLDGIIDAKHLSIKDIQYIGIYGSDKEYIPLMVNPWKGN